MARTIRDTNLETRTARARLNATGRMHFRCIDSGLHLGYRRGERGGGKWFARYYIGARKYRHEAIGSADDVIDADGATILNFSQAQEAARNLFVKRKRALAGLPDLNKGPYTVAHCMDDYIGWLEIHRKSAQDIKYKSDALIIPALGQIDCAKLNTAKLQTWLEELAKSAPRLRAKAGNAPRYRDPPKDDDSRRRRKATANRVLTNLRAALNRAWRNGKIASDDAWRRMKPFQAVDGVRLRYLTLAEARRLINASNKDFRSIVQAALATGARYGELCALNVEDFNPDSGTLHVRQSKSGNGRHVVLAAEGLTFFVKQTVGRGPGEPLLKRATGERWSISHQLRPMAKAVMVAKIEPDASFHCLRHTYASHAIMNGAPLLVVAKNLGHSDTRMVEKHYGHLAPSYIAEAIRAAVPQFGFQTVDEVKPFGVRK